MKEFSEIRSLLNAPVLDKKALWALLNTLSEQDMDRYQSEVVPYLNGYKHLFIDSLVELNSFEEFEHACFIAPFALFSLTLTIKNGLEATTIAQSTHLIGLASLQLHSWIGEKGVVSILQSSHLTSLTHLDLSANDIEYEMGSIMQTPAMISLTHLDLRENYIGNEGIIILAQSPCVQCLRYLDLDENNFGAKGAMALAQSPYLSSLIELHLWGNEIEESAIRAINDSICLPNLVHFNH